MHGILNKWYVRFHVDLLMGFPWLDVNHAYFLRCELCMGTRESRTFTLPKIEYIFSFFYFIPGYMYFRPNARISKHLLLFFYKKNNNPKVLINIHYLITKT